VLSVHASQGSCTSGRPITCSLGPIDNGKHVTITVVAEVRQAGTEKNTASVTSASGDPNPDNNSASAKTKIAPALQIEKTASPRVVSAGQNVSYKITVTDPTSVAANKVTVCDSLPSSLAYLRSNPRAHLRTGRYCWSIHKLGAHHSKTFTIAANAEPGNGGKLVNHATASAPGFRTAHTSASVRMIHTPTVPCGIPSQASVALAGRRDNHDPVAKMAC
jgi:uncharacterized repeat protein (TIGR01451 family)